MKEDNTSNSYTDPLHDDPPSARLSYRFDPFLLDLERGVLEGPSGVARLRPQAFRLLSVMVENAPRILSHDALLDAGIGASRREQRPPAAPRPEPTCC